MANGCSCQKCCTSCQDECSCACQKVLVIPCDCKPKSCCTPVSCPCPALCPPCPFEREVTDITPEPED